jgi:hypothetical protein
MNKAAVKGKGKVVPALSFNLVPHHEGVLGKWSIVPLIL